MCGLCAAYCTRTLVVETSSCAALCTAGRPLSTFANCVWLLDTAPTTSPALLPSSGNRTLKLANHAIPSNTTAPPAICAACWRRSCVDLLRMWLIYRLMVVGLALEDYDFDFFAFEILLFDGELFQGFDCFGARFF
jgi:hypothetical protein